jgi:aminoglycoside phosphotransferase (APT) family kinase protein
MEDARMELFGWIRVADDPKPFLSLMLASPEWLDTALPMLIAAADAAVLTGESLVHFDVRSDNLCFQKRRTVLVDWASAVVGNPLADLVVWLPGLALEGGPAPDDLVGDEATELAALVAGHWASRAGLPAPGVGAAVRSLQRAQLGVALPWVARLLGLPAPH